jgi:prevent-host-death family protein
VAVTVGVRELRENLRAYLDRVKAGEDVIVTERGKPVARLVAPSGADDRLQRLIDAGVARPPLRPRRPLPPPVPVEGSVTEILLEQRRSRPY